MKNTNKSLLIKIDQCTVNFPVVNINVVEQVNQIIKSLELKEIFGDSQQIKAHNFYDKAIGFYNGQICGHIIIQNKE